MLLSLSIVLLLGAGVWLTGCQKEREALLDLDMTQITTMTAGQKAIFDEAVKRLDPYTSFTDGQYRMSRGASAAKLGMSERLFNAMRANMTAINSQLKTSVNDGLVLVEVSRNRVRALDVDADFALTKAAPKPEKFLGGIDDFEYTGYTARIWLSNGTLDTIARIGVFVGIGAGLINKYAGAAVEAIVGGAAELARKHPNGVVITATFVDAGVVPVPTSVHVTGQQQ